MRLYIVTYIRKWLSLFISIEIRVYYSNIFTYMHQLPWSYHYNFFFWKNVVKEICVILILCNGLYLYIEYNIQINYLRKIVNSDPINTRPWLIIQLLDSEIDDEKLAHTRPWLIIHLLDSEIDDEKLAHPWHWQSMRKLLLF